MNPIASCPRRKVYESLDEDLIFCDPPALCADKKNPHCYHAQQVNCKKCKDQEAFILPIPTFSHRRPKKRKAPPVIKQLKTYKRALKKWFKADKITRTNKEIKRLFETHCEPCDDYDSKKHRCRFCGCKVKPTGIAIFNKIKMATEHCPKGLW